jgi:ribosomal protein S12 methylthiotransferase
VRAYRLGRLGAFTYSPEEGTPGYDLDGGVPFEHALERYDAVIDAGVDVLRASQEELVGREVEVLVDEAHTKGEALAVGRTAMDAPEVDLVARIPGCRAAVGERVLARVEAVDDAMDLVCSVPRTPSDAP